MKKWVASAATAATSLLLTFSCTHPNSSGANALSLESRHKFFSQLASGAIKGATTAVVPQIAPGLTQLPTAAPPTAAAANQAERPAIPAVDVEKAGKLESMQKLLERKIQQAKELRDKLDYELKFMKDEGLLVAGKGTTALQGPQAAAGQKGAIGGMLPELAAPIIFLQPPPVTQSQTLEAAEVAETTLAQIGDYSSPAMRAVREYELKKLGEIAGTNLEQIRKEIRETESAIEKRKKERDALTTKLKTAGRELAKAGSRQMELEATFANSDLKEKSKELDILADKLTQLKTRERDLIQREGPGNEAKEELEKEEGEEEELAEEMGGTTREED